MVSILLLSKDRREHPPLSGVAHDPVAVASNRCLLLDHLVLPGNPARLAQLDELVDRVHCPSGTLRPADGRTNVLKKITKNKKTY